MLGRLFGVTARMNALLASGEVPGLYEGKELTALMAGCREAAQRDGVLIDSEDELFRRFTNKVLYTAGVFDRLQ